MGIAETKKKRARTKKRENRWEEEEEHCGGKHGEKEVKCLGAKTLEMV